VSMRRAKVVKHAKPGWACACAGCANRRQANVVRWLMEQEDVALLQTFGGPGVVRDARLAGLM
jgi:hypothetical protein